MHYTTTQRRRLSPFTVSQHQPRFSCASSSYSSVNQTTKTFPSNPQTRKFSRNFKQKPFFFSIAKKSKNKKKFTFLASNLMSRVVNSIFPICIIVAVVVVGAGAESPSAYEVLSSYHFPVGLLPKGVKGFDLDPNTGKFNAYLNGSCSFSLEGSYQLMYKSTISGYIEENRLTRLSGISVKVLFFWLNIVEVTRSDDELEFSVGIASAVFPLDNFEECPQCGCGLDCNSGLIRKVTTNSFAASM